MIEKQKKSHSSNSRNREKKTEPKGSEMTFAPLGRNSTSKHGTMWAQIATSHIVQGLAEGAAPTTPKL